VWSDSNLHLFYDLGWIHDVTVDEKKRLLCEEESQQSSVKPTDPPFHFGWIEEQVSFHSQFFFFFE